MFKKGRIPVSSRALLQRINRILANEGEIVKKARSRAETTVGEYFRIDIQGNYVVGTHIDLEELGRKIDALHSFEELVD